MNYSKLYDNKLRNEEISLMFSRSIILLQAKVLTQSWFFKRSPNNMGMKKETIKCLPIVEMYVNRISKKISSTIICLI